jgi:O-antigen ligase
MSKTLFERGRYFLLWASLLSMLVGLICSRAAMSIGEILFIIAALSTTGTPGKLKQFYSSFSLWGIQLLFLLPFISFFWSEDKTEWIRVMEIKAPLFFLPLSLFVIRDFFSPEKIRLIAFIAIGLCMAGTIWSLVQYVQHLAGYNKLYLRAKIFPTPMDDEHLRFSQLCAVCVLLLLMLWQVCKQPWHRWLMTLAILWLVIYLHVLASRMGLIGLYIILGIYAASQVRTKTGKKLFLLVAVLIAVSSVSYFIFPTLQNRMRYVKWDYEQYSAGNFRAGLNDAPRIVSYKAGWDLFKLSPVTGLGSGDVKNELMNWYDENLPALPAYQRLFPTSEWLMYADATGIMGFLVLTVVILLPWLVSLKTRQKELFIFHSLMILSFLFEINLTVQYGIFLYLFFCFIIQKLKAPGE